MKLGILSDTHNHTQNLQRAITFFRNRTVTTLIHCGDMTSPTTAELLKDFHVIAVTGNMDMNTGRLEATLKMLNPENSLSATFTGEIEGVAIAATHSHRGNVPDLAANGRFAYIFHGHTHRHRDEQVNGTRIINPGALGGTRHEPRSICIVDLATNRVEFIQIGD
ncbi:MAG: metallophosphoesterase family protein [Anaerolineae bacterium]|nr:metallophosphoesterase family protein [Anaerolineae bacterium]